MFFKLIFISTIFSAKFTLPLAQTQLPQCECLAAKIGQPLVMNAQPPDQQNIGDTCSTKLNIVCDPNSSTPCRYMDGRCNNANHTTWGMTNNTIVRLLPPFYSQNPQDRPESPRVSSTDNISSLPSPRIFSEDFFTNKRSLSERYTLAFTVLGQIMAHDVISIFLRNPPPKTCCKDTQRVPQKTWDHGCLSIDIPTDDKFYKKFNIKCIQFTRAQTSDEFGCPLPQFEQGNSVTSFLDGSVVYGASDEVVTQLRSFDHGKLKFQKTSDGRVFLPNEESADASCSIPNNNGSCFLGSDDRVDMHSQLALMQVVLLRVHNKLCDELITINANNSRWDGNDELIFQETKRIITGMLQNIFFGRYAEIIFGPECAAAYGLTPTATPEQIYDIGYDPELNSGTIAEFQHVAFRAFHTLVEEHIQLYDENRTVINTLKLSDWFYNPTIIMQPGVFDQMLIGLATQQMPNFDRFYSTSVTEELFKQYNNYKYGSDLASIDSMRGRDCGIQPYINLSTLAGFTPAQNFNDLTTQINPKMVQRLQMIYKDVRDIDAIVGAILEKPFGNSLVGKTLHSILAEQFRRYKYGDSKFYTFDGPAKFYPEQLTAIKSTSLSFLMCYGSDGIQSIQKDAFSVSNISELVPCYTIINDFLQQLRVYWADKNTN